MCPQVSWHGSTRHCHAWSRADASGNAGTCEFSVVVLDKQAPAFVNCPAVVNGTTNMGERVKALFWDELLAEDNSQIASIECSHRVGDLFPIGDTLVRLPCRSGGSSGAKPAEGWPRPGGVQRNGPLAQPEHLHLHCDSACMSKPTSKRGNPPALGPNLPRLTYGWFLPCSPPPTLPHPQLL